MLEPGFSAFQDHDRTRTLAGEGGPPGERTRRAGGAGPPQAGVPAPRQRSGGAGPGAVITSPRKSTFQGRGPATSPDVPSPSGVWAERRRASDAGLRRGERRPSSLLLATLRLFPHQTRGSQLCHRRVSLFGDPHPQLRPDLPTLPEGCGPGLRLRGAQWAGMTFSSAWAQALRWKCSCQ